MDDHWTTDTFSRVYEVELLIFFPVLLYVRPKTVIISTLVCYFKVKVEIPMLPLHTEVWKNSMELICHKYDPLNILKSYHMSFSTLSLSFFLFCFTPVLQWNTHTLLMYIYLEL